MAFGIDQMMFLHPIVFQPNFLMTNLGLIYLQSKHPEVFKSFIKVKKHIEFVLDGPEFILKASHEPFTLLIRRSDVNHVAIVEFVLKGGKYRVKSAHNITNDQLIHKIEKANGKFVNASKSWEKVSGVKTPDKISGKATGVPSDTHSVSCNNIREKDTFVKGSNMKKLKVESGKRKVGNTIVSDYSGKKYRIYDQNPNWVTLIPEEGEVSDKFKVPVDDFYENYILNKAPKKNSNPTDELGMIAEVLDDKGKDILIVGEGVPQLFGADNSKKTFRLITKPRHEHDGAWVPRLEPLNAKPGRYAFGGKFAYSHDSRFKELNNGLPIPIFDYDMSMGYYRIENPTGDTCIGEAMKCAGRKVKNPTESISIPVEDGLALLAKAVVLKINGKIVQLENKDLYGTADRRWLIVAPSTQKNWKPSNPSGDAVNLYEDFRHYPHEKTGRLNIPFENGLEYIGELNAVEYDSDKMIFKTDKRTGKKTKREYVHDFDDPPEIFKVKGSSAFIAGPMSKKITKAGIEA